MHRCLLLTSSGRAALLLRVRVRMAAGGDAFASPGGAYYMDQEGFASSSMHGRRPRTRPRPRSFATNASTCGTGGTSAGITGRDAGAAAGAVATAFSSIDAATDARLASKTRKNNQNNGTAVLADLLLTLSAQARDISARVPPTSRNGSNPRGGGSAAEPQTAPLPIMTIPAPSMQSTDEPDAAYVPHQKKKVESATSTPCTGGAEAAMATISDLNRATDAAEALLVLTASPALRNAFASRDDGCDNDRGRVESGSDVSSTTGGKTKKKKKESTRGNQPSGAGVVLDRDTVESLHFAFVTVSSWLQSSIRRAAAATANSTTQQQAVVDEAIVHAIELTVRSADLALPLTAPLYKSLASDVVAAHASPASHPSLQIMEVANLLRISLFPAFNPPPVSFFHGPCVALVRRGMVREAIELLDEMDAEFGIGEVEAMTGLDMLSAVAEGMGLVNNDDAGSGNGGDCGGSQASIVFGKVGRSRSGGGTVQGGTGRLAMELDPVDATELVFRLRGPLLRQLGDVSKELRREMDSAAEGAEANSELVDLLESLSRPAADIDNDGENSTGNNEDDGENDDGSEEHLLEEYLEAADDSPAIDDKANALADIETLSDAVSSLAEDGSGPSPASAVGRSRSSDASTSTIYSTYQIPQSLHNQMTSEMIYVRKGPSWDLPDLVEQLKIFNDGKDILYTRQYEEEMISAMMRDWEGDEDDFDDLDGYDDDGEERER